MRAVENTRNISTLKRVSDLDSKESKTEVKELSKGQIAFFCHDVYFIENIFIFTKSAAKILFFFYVRKCAQDFFAKKLRKRFRNITKHFVFSPQKIFFCLG